MVEISVVVPVFRSEDCIEELNRRVTSALDGRFRYELILVNDCSPDLSWKSIEMVTRINPNAIGINLRKNSGQDNAIMCGLSMARGEFIVIMDDDLQHSPDDIPILHAECVKRDIDVCYARFTSKQQALWKNLGSWLNGKISEIIIEKPAKLYLSPFKILRADIAVEMTKYKGPYPYIDGLIFSVTRNVGEIEIAHHRRYAGKSNYNFMRSLLVFLKMATGYSVIPLRISSYFGILCSLSGFLLAVYYIASYFIRGSSVEGWTTLSVLILILGGLTLFSIGMLGEYLGRTYLQVSGRPQYTIRDITGKRE